ncbi:hypothetical protein [Acinetobacter sp. WCHAc060042]|uniref:hypothetical protein n=2 Tax=unclassified Acinetobacter TaxID=196816 RepID=UPI000DA6AD7D|nr:hypothetical protein [Acinetobacter sp. WCHAc060042]
MNTEFIDDILSLKKWAILSLESKFEKDWVDPKVLEHKYNFIKSELQKLLNLIESKNYSAEEKIELIENKKEFSYGKNSIFNEYSFFMRLVTTYYSIIQYKENREKALKLLHKNFIFPDRNNLAKFLSSFFFHFLNREDFLDESKHKIGLEILKEEYSYSFSEFLNFDIKQGDILQSLLVLRVLQILRLLGLSPDFSYERKVAHYTSIAVANDLLFKSKARLRINSTEFMNDRTEGKLLDTYLNLNPSIDSESLNFLTSYTFNHNHLNQFRLYGKTNQKEGSGVSLVLITDLFGLVNTSLAAQIQEFIRFSELEEIRCKEFFRFNKLPIFRCCYLDPNSDYLELAKRSKLSFYKELTADGWSASSIELEWKKYNKTIENNELNVKRLLRELKEYIKVITNNQSSKMYSPIGSLLSLVSFLFKHAAFKEEEECRVIYCTDISDTRIKNIFDINNLLTYTFVNYDIELKSYWKNIYIGPASFQYLSYFKKALYDHNMQDVRVSLSDHPLRS